MGALKREMGERARQGIDSAFTSKSSWEVSHDKSRALQPPLASFRPTRAPSCFVQWLCPCSLRRLQQQAIASLVKLSVILPHSCCQYFQSEPRLLLHSSAVPPAWQMVHSEAAATAERTWWRCDSTVEIFQWCCSEKLQWGKGTVQNSIMYIKVFIHPSLHTRLEGIAVPVINILLYLRIMKFCSIKTRPTVFWLSLSEKQISFFNSFDRFGCWAY